MSFDASSFATASCPVIMVEKTPRGKPADSKASSTERAEPGQAFECLSIVVFPAMTVGIAKRNTCQKG
jgi:hypothetical protein